MATPKTETSELSVAFGLLGIQNPVAVNYNDIKNSFQDTLSEEKFSVVRDTYLTDPLFNSMRNVGGRLRESYPLFHNLQAIRWTGGDRQAATMSTAKDLQAANVPISVKAESRVVGNPSPYNLFVATPSGSAQARGMGSWYLETAPIEYQRFYAFTRDSLAFRNLPDTARAFESSRDKKVLKRALTNMNEADKPEFQRLYVEMCSAVSTKSAERFNTLLEQSLNSRTRSSVLEQIARMFFRMDAVEYILCGIDGGNEFAVELPDLTSWLREWQFEQIKAAPDITKEQSTVNFELALSNKKVGTSYSAQFHAEVRWSHGKFSSVEGKLYKEFEWIRLPFFEILV